MYARMYAIVCGAASDAIECLDRGEYASARVCLLAALERAEEIYLQTAEEAERSGQEKDRSYSFLKMEKRRHRLCKVAADGENML